MEIAGKRFQLISMDNAMLLQTISSGQEENNRLPGRMENVNQNEMIVANQKLEFVCTCCGRDCHPSIETPSYFTITGYFQRG